VVKKNRMTERVNKETEKESVIKREMQIARICERVCVGERTTGKQKECEREGKRNTERV